MKKDPSILPVLRHFVVSLFAASPRRTIESFILTIGVSLFEGVGLLLLIPMLQLIGLDTGQGSLGGVFSTLRAGFDAVGITPTLPAVLLLYVGVVALQSALVRRQALVNARLREDLVHSLRDRVYRAVVGSTWVYFSRRRASAFLQILTEKIDYVSAAAYSLITFAVAIGVSLAYIVMALRVSVPLTGLVMVSGGLLALGLRGRLNRGRQAGRKYWAASSQLHAATSRFSREHEDREGIRR